MAKYTAERWKDPAFRAHMVTLTRFIQPKASDARRKLTRERLESLLADYAELHPTGRRRYRYSGKEIAIRYGVSADHVYDLAQRAGLQRYDAAKRATTLDREAA
jgi:hypothetical protein